jgi:hypothetical protein
MTRTLVGTPDPEPQPQPEGYGTWTLSTGNSSISNSPTGTYWFLLYNPS